MEPGGKEATRSLSLDVFSWDGELWVLIPSQQIVQMTGQ